MKNINIVLVRTKYPRNIGMVSRLMENFAVDRLILVNPQCELTYEAQQGAAQGQLALQNATIYKSWDDYYKSEKDSFRIALTRRQGRRRASQSLQELLKTDEFPKQNEVTFIFGAEDHGLRAEDMELVHRVAHFDLPGNLQSMNLSHAVLMVLQSYYSHFGPIHEVIPNSDEIISPEPSLRLWLEALGFDLESHNKWNVLTMLKQLIMRAGPTNEELYKLDMILQQTTRKLKASTPPKTNKTDI